MAQASTIANSETENQKNVGVRAQDGARGLVAGGLGNSSSYRVESDSDSGEKEIIAALPSPLAPLIYFSGDFMYWVSFHM